MLVSEGSLCPCTEPDEMMTMAAQPGGSGRTFPQVSSPGDTAQETRVGLFPQRRAAQSPAEQTPLDFGCNPSTQTHHMKFAPVDTPRPLEDRGAQGKLEA